MTDFNGLWLLVGLLVGVTAGVAVMIGLFALGDGLSMARRVCSCDDYSPHFHHDGRRWFG